ncbi:MAG: electron transfer flavoprotein beta subunit/FixA family protein [Chloroflexi bacterium]|nr:electron transfer flavoprotein beta subunit/FixA family protein [Chloroflexota bacterium]
MKIAVFVKQVPDSAATLSVKGGQPDWGDAPLVINPWDEYAVEAALLLAEANGGEVTAFSFGSESAADALKHALAMGVSDAVLLSDPALSGADAGVAARVMAAAIAKLSEVDLAVFGKQAIDSDTGLAPSMTARLLGWPSLTLVAAVDALDASAKTIKVQRSMEEGRQVVQGKLPAVISVVKDYGEPRYPSFMGIRKASKAEIPTWSMADLGIEAPTSRVTWPEIMAPPMREVSNEIIEGSSPEEIAGKLADKIIAEGVL